MEVRKIPDGFLQETKVEDGFETRIYQMQLLHCEFPEPLNVVILLRTNLALLFAKDVLSWQMKL